MLNVLTADMILADEQVQGEVRKTNEMVIDMVRRLIDNKPVANEVYLNKHILANAINSYYCDLYRISLFRGIVADSHKQAAFLVKWIIRLRPVQIHASVQNPSKDTLLINEVLAVSVALVILFRQLEDIPGIIAADRHYIQSLVYLFRYHSCPSPEQLASEFYQFDKNIRARSTNQQQYNI